MTIRNLAILAVVAAFAVASCGGSDTSPAESPEGGTGIESAAAQDNTVSRDGNAVEDNDIWYYDWDTGMAAAKEQDKPVFVHFTADWCVYCRKMNNETYTVEDVKQRLKNDWIGIKVDVENTNQSNTIYLKEEERQFLAYLETEAGDYATETVENKRLLSFFGQGLPTLVFFDTEGQPVFADAGFRPAEAFGPMLDYFQQELYKQEVNLGDYVESKS